MKKNLRKIPLVLLEKLKTMRENDIVAIAVKNIKLSEIKEGSYTHLTIELKDNEVTFQNEILPDDKMGKFSYWNKFGKEIKRKDLPMETYYNYIESPNWGDSSNGTHTVALPGKRYPVEFIPPALSKIKIELLKSGSSKENFLFRFILSEVYDKKDKNINEKLFSGLNILQENVGTCDIDKSGVTISEYLKTHTVSWEIFPPGTKEEFINRIFKGRQYSEKEKNTVSERYDYFIKLKPKEMIIGANGFQRYFGAKLEEDLVIFENTEYGNALYIMYSSWEILSKKSRIDLLSGRYGKDFERIIHTGAWKENVNRIVTDQRKKSKHKKH